MAGSMKDIKLRIKSVESTMQITKAMELVASSKMRRAKERVEHSRPYFETLHKTLTEIAAADPRARNPYLRRAEIKKTLLIVIAGDRGLAGGYNSNVLRQAQQEAGDVVVLPIGKRSAEYFVHHEVPLFTQEVLLAADITVGECFQLARRITEGYCKGAYDAVKICYTRFDSMMTQTAVSIEVLPLAMEPTEQQKAEAGITDPQNLEEQAISLVGTDIYEKLIKGYTGKQWGRPCTELPAFIIKRLPVRFTYDNNYFNALYQGIPNGGYTAMVENMLEGTEVRLNVDYLADREALNALADKVVYTGPVDAYFDYRLGALQYRSVRFETEVLDTDNYQGNAVVNYTDAETPYTRIIEHKHFEFGTQPKTVISREYSCLLYTSPSPRDA